MKVTNKANQICQSDLLLSLYQLLLLVNRATAGHRPALCCVHHEMVTCTQQPPVYSIRDIADLKQLDWQQQ